MKENKTVEIVAFGRGNVICHRVDKAKQEKDDFGTVWLQVDSGATIRRWGTEHGLAQLSETGPTNDTILDGIPHKIRIPVPAIHLILTCTDSSSEKFDEEMKAADLKILGSQDE